MITKEEREAREQAAQAKPDSVAAGLHRIADALEALAELGAVFRDLAQRELATHLAAPEEPQ